MPTKDHKRHAEHLADFVIRSVKKEAAYCNVPTGLHFVDRIIKGLTPITTEEGFKANKVAMAVTKINT